MPAAMNLNADDLERTAKFLRAMTAATKEFGVQIAPYSRSDLKVGDTAIGFIWDDDREQYVLDDQVGS